MNERTLKEIALDLLNKYEEAKETVIWEYSGTIDDDIEELHAEVEKTRLEIESATIDAIPVRRGKWITTKFNGTFIHLCSECGSDYGKLYFRYCPGCGAKMEADHEID